MNIPWRWYRTHALKLIIQRLLGKKSCPSKRSHNCSSCSDGLWSSFNVFIWKKWISGWSGASGSSWRRDDNYRKRERRQVGSNGMKRPLLHLQCNFPIMSKQTNSIWNRPRRSGHSQWLPLAWTSVKEKEPSFSNVNMTSFMRQECD